MEEMDDAQLTVEKRRFPRVTISLNVRFKVITSTPEGEELAKGRDALICRSTNVSKGGVALYSPHKLSKGDLIKAELALPGSAKPVKAFAEVKWCVAADGGQEGAFRAGIVFMALRREDEERLEVFLDKLSGDI